MSDSADLVTSFQVVGPEELSAAIRNSNLETCQLSRSPAPSWMARALCTDLCLDIVELGPAMLFSGAMPVNCYTLVFVTKCPNKGHSFNFSTEHVDGYIGFFPPGGALDAHTPEGYANATLTVAADVFLAAVTKSFPEMPGRILTRGAGMRINPPEQSELRLLVDAVIANAKENNPLNSHLIRRARLEKVLLDSFLRILRAGCEQLIPPPNKRMTGKMHHLRLARDFIKESAKKSFQLDELTHAVGMSERGLEMLFHQTLGINPSAFIRHQRLHGVRRALLAADPATFTVKELALEWGFWHMGHFARNYQSIFGEKPSTTLMRS